MTTQVQSESANHGPKLRTSCDKCQLSKVRCSRGKPSCWRCSQSGIECVYSPLRKTGRPPKNGDNSSSQQRKARRRGSSTTVRSDSPRAAHQATSPDSAVQSCQLSQDGFTNGEQEARSLILNQHQQMAASSAGPALHQVENTTSRAPEGPALLSMAAAQVDMDGGGFPVLDMDMVLDIDMWAMSTMPELGVHATHGDIGLPTITASHTLGPSHSAYESMPALSATALSSQYGAGAYEPEAKPCLFPVERSTHGNTTTTQLTTMTYLSSRPPSSGFSRHGLSHPDTQAVRLRPDEHDKPRSCSQEETCHKALSEMLTRLGDFYSSKPVAMLLEELLLMGRELHGRAHMTMNCQRCMQKPSNQNLLMMVYMAMDGLLSLFEELQQHDMNHAIRSSKQFQWAEQTMAEGGFVADDAAKTGTLRRLVLEYCDNVLSVLAELYMVAYRIMQGVNSIIYKHKAEDIYKRAYTLSTRLLLTAGAGNS
ncbi:C6 zinc finger domain [Cordyceps militaris]|uniref:C6 zinc finger domain n=1 Tax=Cordyceps militaris TaxID=73501 RepID=A0A2H4SVT0_CORMI|nr:C6 zinc finger domain [Cordyceps militaris]